MKTMLALHPLYGRRGGPSRSTLQRLVAKFETTDSVKNQPHHAVRQHPYVYANAPQSTDALKINITEAIAQTQPDLCSRVIDNWTTRIRATVRSRGGHLNDVIFHT